MPRATAHKRSAEFPDLSAGTKAALAADNVSILNLCNLILNIREKQRD